MWKPPYQLAYLRNRTEYQCVIPTHLLFSVLNGHIWCISLWFATFWQRRKRNTFRNSSAHADQLFKLGKTTSFLLPGVGICLSVMMHMPHFSSPSHFWVAYFVNGLVLNCMGIVYRCPLTLGLAAGTTFCINILPEWSHQTEAWCAFHPLPSLIPIPVCLESANEGERDPYCTTQLHCHHLAPSSAEDEKCWFHLKKKRAISFPPLSLSLASSM